MKRSFEQSTHNQGSIKKARREHASLKRKAEGGDLDTSPTKWTRNETTDNEDEGEGESESESDALELTERVSVYTNYMQFNAYLQTLHFNSRQKQSIRSDDSNDDDPMILL